ncbi:MAG: thermonuclease family protein [Rhizobiaceae bacterium]
MMASFAVAATVVDGDTIRLDNSTYRLEGIDAPEYGQKCKTKNGGSWKCGKIATEALVALIEGRFVRCEGNVADDFGRLIAICYADGVDLNQQMIKSGMAWAFRKFSQTYVAEEADARAAGRGIWQADSQTPWDYRAKRWEVAAQKAPDGCPIKGNISRNGRIYHAPWSPWYSRTKISVNKGERWFCDEAEALEAGWRAPYWGR